MKKILLCLFSFLFIGTALTGSVFLLAGCNQSYSQEDNEENNNENENNTGEDIPDEDEEISAQGYRLDAYIMSFNQAYPSGYNNTNGGTVETWSNSGLFWTWVQNGTGVGTHHSYFTNREWGEVVTQIAYSSGYRLRGYYSTSSCTGTDMTSQFTGNDSYDGDDSNTKVSTGHFQLSRARSIYVKSARKVKMNFSTSWGSLRGQGPHGPTSDASFSISGYFGDTTRTFCSASPRAGYTFQWINTNGNKVVSTNNTGFFGVESAGAQNFLRGTSTYGNATSDGSNGVVYNFETRYNPITYYVKFNGNGATSGSMSNQTFTYDKSQNLRSNTFSRTGYNFAGWATTSTGSVQYTNGQSVSNLTTTSYGTVNLYAVWKPKTFTNTYYYRNSNGSQASANQSRSYNSSFTTYSASSLSYYTSNGWGLYGWLYNSSTGTGRTYAPSTSVTSATYTQSQSTLGWYAVSSRKITISYNGNGGSYSGGSTTGTQYWNQYGNVVTSVNIKVTSTVPTRTGYTFKGWATSSNATSANYGSGATYTYSSGYTSSPNITLFAVWQANQYDNVYRYRNNSGGQAESVQKRTYKQAFTTLSSSALSYYTSNGWNLYGWLYNDQNGTSRTFAPSASVSSSTYLNSTSTLYWYATSSRTVTLSYNGNGGSYSGGSTTGTQYWNQYGNKVTSVSLKVTSTVPTRTGYTFKGWATSSTATSANYASGATYTYNAGYSSSQNVTLYAVWQVNSYYVDVNMTLNGSGVSNFLGSFDVSANGTVKATNATDFYQQIAYGSTVRVYDIISNAGYTYQSYSINVSGIETSNSSKSSIEIKMPAQAISINLYQVSNVYTMTLDRQGATNGTSAIYMKYGVGWYSNSSATTAITSVPTLPTKAGFTFGGYFTETNGGGTQIVSSSGQITGANNYITANDTLYAKWTANLDAKKDTAGGYYYVEIGNMPQTRVTDSSLISQLNSATTNGGTYYINGTTMVSKKVNNVEYCKYGNNWYKVEPIRWRLAYSSSQKSGYGTTTDTFAVLDTIVYAGQYASGRLGGGQGYVTTTLDEFKKNITSTTYLAAFSANVESYTGTGITSSSQSANMFISSADEISSVLNNKTGSAKYSVKFSDLVKDILGKGIHKYYTRNLGSNTSTIKSYTELGMLTQNLCTNIQGVQFTIKVSEYGCVG